MKPDEPLQRGGLQTPAGRPRDLIVDAARDAHAKQLGFALFQRLGFGDLPDLVVGELGREGLTPRHFLREGNIEPGLMRGELFRRSFAIGIGLPFCQQAGSVEIP